MTPDKARSQTEALLPCPFCGGTDFQTAKANGEWGGKLKYAARVSCNSCRAGGPKSHSKDGANGAWNTLTRSQPVGEEDEVFWWWASGSVARHIPDREYQVVLKSDYDKLKASLSAAREWIPVSERYPDKDAGTIIVATNHMGIRAVTIMTASYLALMKQAQVTHWQPLPEPPALKPGGKS